LFCFRNGQLLRTSGLEAKPYVIEDHKVLYVVQTGAMDMVKVRSFLLDQAEVYEFEYAFSLQHTS
jgi:hypothetical protein